MPMCQYPSVIEHDLRSQVELVACARSCAVAATGAAAHLANRLVRRRDRLALLVEELALLAVAAVAGVAEGAAELVTRDERWGVER